MNAEGTESLGRSLPGGLPIKVTSSISPVVKLRKKVQAMGTTLSLSCAYHTVDRLATFETTWRDSFIGGELSVTDNLQQVQWRKMWLLPGLSDAATKIEVVSAFDLRTLRADARVRLGLRRRFSKAGISLAHLVNLDGPDGRAKLEVGATLLVPDELDVSALELIEASKSGVTDRLLQGTWAVDIDRFNLCLDL